MRTSSYTIYVDLPDNRSEMLLVHGYTGAYDRVSRRVASFLRSREARRAPRPLYGEWSPEPEVPEDSEPPSEEVVRLLEQRGYLTPLAPEDEEKLFARLAEKLHERSTRRTPSYVFMPTYNCNLRCSYCFQDYMRTDPGFGHLLRTMSPAMVDRIFTAIPRIEALHDLRAADGVQRRVGFFGGEPLLAENRDVVGRIVEKAQALGKTEFWAVTNGTELDAYRGLLGPEGIARLQITLDGPPDEHDRRRIYADSSPSFERIAGNVTWALELGVRISIRLNLDRHNLGDLPRLAEEIHARGWPAHRTFSAYSAPIHAINEKTDKKSTMNSWELDQALVRMHQEHPRTTVIGRPDEAIRLRARKVFEEGDEILPDLRPSFCGAHSQMYILDPFGDVYACWEKTGDPRIRIGHITAEGEWESQHEVLHTWRSRSVASNPVCRRCRYALHCGGGCAVLALGQIGKLHANYCDGFASRFRSSIAEAYRDFIDRGDLVSAPPQLCDL